jgi:hypothetical protein
MEHWWKDVDWETEELGLGERNSPSTILFITGACHMHWHGMNFRPVLMRDQQVELFMLSHAF